MPPTYSRQSRSSTIARRLSGPQSPAINGEKSPIDENAASKRNGRRVIRLTSRSSNNKGDQETAAEEESQKGEEGEEERSEEAKSDDAEEEKKLYQRWAEEYYEVVEQLPLELHRTFALMRELENKMQERIAFVAEYTKLYRDARFKHRNEREQERQEINNEKNEEELAQKEEKEKEQDQVKEKEQQPDEQQQYHNASVSIVHPDYGSSSDMDAEGEDEEIFHEAEPITQIDLTPSPVELTPPTNLPVVSTPLAARQSMLAGIARASSEAIRAAEEKVGLAVTAYDWVDRHIRRLDGDLQRNESSLLLGLRAGTEASRGVRDALGISDGDNTFNRKGIEAAWGSGEDDSMMSNQSTPMPNGSALARKSKNANGNLDDSINGQLSTAAFMGDMAIDPNEPKYCYCDEVSSGDMVACDNEDCPREWFHYHCLGLTSPPKGRWFCLFCIGPGRKTSGTYPPNAPCLPPGYGSKRANGSNSNHKSKKSNSKKRKW